MRELNNDVKESIVPTIVTTDSRSTCAHLPSGFPLVSVNQNEHLFIIPRVNLPKLDFDLQLKVRGNLEKFSQGSSLSESVVTTHNLVSTTSSNCLSSVLSHSPIIKSVPSVSMETS